MKTNPYDAAFIRTTGSIATPTDGLTKLEYFAGLAMQGILANSKYYEENTNSELVKCAVNIAKALIDELNKEESEDETNQNNS